ncbi:phage tail assembly chaperone [Novosphingobium sp. Rr 2-17]|uniref:phage tail assembly chaperone n=1 Tax=Novosphingobium sp. Rr 2-17 TaxID=555793 RepID=UPI001ED9425F|nr:hypothetical protein [Novosphingobium sp. Rr 2-17]
MSDLMDMARNGSDEAKADALEALGDAPLIKPASKWYWSVFNDLGSDRPPAFQGISRIPFTAIRAYADEYQVSGKMREALIQVTRNVDIAYCAMIAEKSLKSRPKTKP